jgi:hypothetical protein
LKAESEEPNPEPNSKQQSMPSNTPSVTSGTDVTSKIVLEKREENTVEKKERNPVTVATSVTDKSSIKTLDDQKDVKLETSDRKTCFLCNKALPVDFKDITYFNGKPVHLNCATTQYGTYPTN